MSASNNLHECKHYLIHDNYGRPFCVYIDESLNEVHIYKIDYNNETENMEHIKHIGTYKPEKVFVGISKFNPMTAYSGGYGPYFDGNSILLKMSNNEYIFIGDQIYSFNTDNEIVTFESPVGNNDVPYPYAKDDKENYYLLLDDETCSFKIDNISERDDPYKYYYKLRKNIQDCESIKWIYMNDEKYCLTTHPYPAEKYDDLINRLGSPMYIQYKGRGQRKRLMEREKYIELLENYNKKNGLRPLYDVKIIEKRDW
jgi:hypothetical protein